MKKGFTLLELVVVIGIIALISVIIILSLSSRSQKTNLDTATKNIVSLLREAQSRSMSQASGSAWGVRFSNTTSSFYALFLGTYSTSTERGHYALPPGVIFSSSTIPVGTTLDIIFSQISGLPSASTSIEIIPGEPPGIPNGFHIVPIIVSSSSINISGGGLISF